LIILNCIIGVTRKQTIPHLGDFALLSVRSSLRKVKSVWLIKHYLLKTGGGVEV